MAYHPNSIGVETTRTQDAPVLHGINQGDDIKGTTTQLLRPRRRTVAGQHQLLLVIVAARMLRQQHGVTMLSQDLSPSFKRLRFIPETVGYHHQSTIGLLGKQDDQLQGFRPMRYRELQNITAPAAGECGPQRRIHRGRRPGIHEGNPLLKIRFQTIGDIHNTRQVQGGLLPRQFL